MISNRSDLQKIRLVYEKSLAKQTQKILVCCGTGCVAGGADKIYHEMVDLLEKKGIECSVELKEEPHHDSVGVKKSGCHGFCEKGPLLKLEPSGVLYIKVQVGDCEEIIDKTIVHGEVIDRLLYEQHGQKISQQEQIPFYHKQKRIVLESCGTSDATSIKDYIGTGGYTAIEKVLFEMTPDEVVDEIQKSKLRGRGGAGFPTGIKWKGAKAQVRDKKYVICNADEGDPGAFMDRAIIEGNPHAIIESMLICAHTIGSDEGIVYVRAEYPLAITRLKMAIEQAEEYNLLGNNILGTDFCFKLRIKAGAGAFVCGEVSALIASIEGKRGMPRVKPPRTVEKGLFGKPTLVNNVETYACVPKIINHGADWFLNIGTPNSPGTKAFALTGNIENTGLIEVPMGTTLKEIVFDIGGGIKDNVGFKAVQIGGPSGGCLVTEHFDLPLDFDSLDKVGAMIGSGGLVVMDENTCMVEVARFFMNFTQNESCGKCVPCREGTKQMLHILERIVAGNGTLEDLDKLEELGDFISDTSLCGLGQTAAFPVLSTLKSFRNEYEAHVVDKKCPAKVCAKLKKIYIDPDLCKGCSKCAKVCPVSAISGKIKEPYTINETCIKCDSCISSCKFGAIKEAF